MDEVMASAVFVIVKSDIDGWCVQRQELAKIYWGKSMWCSEQDCLCLLPMKTLGAALL
jgi:hypothetical protein